MAVNGLMLLGKNLVKSLVQTDTVTACFTTVPPEVFRNPALPIAAVNSIANISFSKAFNVEQKPRLVQIVFPFVSGLAGIAICSTFLSTKLLATYLVSSTIISVCVLAMMLLKKVIGSEHKPRKESYVPRVINYTVVGATTLLPCAMAGIGLGNALNLIDPHKFALMGFFFGMAQACTNWILGARQENPSTQFALPLLSTALSMLIFGSLAGFTSSGRGAFEIISTVALGVGMVMTIASNFFVSQPKPDEALKAEPKSFVKEKVEFWEGLTNRTLHSS